MVPPGDELETIRDEVGSLVLLGPLPSSDTATVEVLDEYTQLLEAIERPVSRGEALALLSVFPASKEEDDCFGLAWTVLHLVETAAGEIDYRDVRTTGPWIDRLKARAEQLSP